jgi:hypothetical protein
MYAAINWFLLQATRFRKERRSTAIQRERWQATYRAGLYEQLAGRLAQLQNIWNRGVGKNLFASQRKAGHAIAISSKKFTEMQKEFHRLMLRSVSWMPHDPRVRNWYFCRRKLSDRDYLRKARIGFEKGILPPLYPQEVKSRQSLNDQIRSLSQKGFSTRRIAAELRKTGHTISHTTVAARLRI